MAHLFHFLSDCCFLVKISSGSGRHGAWEPCSPPVRVVGPSFCAFRGCMQVCAPSRGTREMVSQANKGRLCRFGALCGGHCRPGTHCT
ncbi:unnamed protein product [Ixodes persulcatus]